MNKQEKTIYRNYQFYSKAQWLELKPPIRDIIDNWPKIKDIKTFYTNLESDHSYIQWLFPNFYSSKFNPNSYKLCIEERKLMIEQLEILKRLYKNYKLILRFFGIGIHFYNFDDDINENKQQSKQIVKQQKLVQKKLDFYLPTTPSKDSQQENEKQQQLSQQKSLKEQLQSSDSKTNTDKKDYIQNEQSIDQEELSKLILIDQQQFEKCCFSNTHNLLRLKRILGCLSVLKHRKEAIQLCYFLKQEFSKRKKDRIYDQYFSGFEPYYEELTEKQQKSLKQEPRYFNGYKQLYVDESLIESVDISLIN